jgi:Na+-transporting methylmalonyl-CoA/oxaloacetate decarboxylase gamma subunit
VETLTLFVGVGVVCVGLAVVFLVTRLMSDGAVPSSLSAAARKREKNSRRKARETSR